MNYVWPLYLASESINIQDKELQPCWKGAVCEANFIEIHSLGLVVEIFQSGPKWWAGQHTNIAKAMSNFFILIKDYWESYILTTENCKNMTQYDFIIMMELLS